MKEIVLTLPYPPSVNHYKKVGRLHRTKTGKIFQGRVNTDETNRFYYEVWVTIRQWNATQCLQLPLGEEIDFMVTIELHPPDKRMRDIDNGIKIILDSLQRGGLIKNDHQISRLFVSRSHIIEQGQIIVTVSPIEGHENDTLTRSKQKKS